MIDSSEKSPFPDVSFAFQPIVDITTGSIVAFEALVRGVERQSAKAVFEQVKPVDLHRFDEMLRLKAIPLAARLQIGCNLNLNLLPRSLTRSQTAITSTL